MTNRAVILRPGQKREIVPMDREATLEEIQAWVEGYVQEIPGPCRYENEPAQFFVNEEGLLRDLPPNVAATHLVKAQATDVAIADSIRGTMVILQGKARWR